MAEADAALAKILDEAGAEDHLRKYLSARKINTVAILAAIATDTKELDKVLKPLEDGFVLPDSTKLKLSELELPVERARLRQIWKACDKAENGAATKTLPAVPVASGSGQSSKVPKDLPAGYWQTQIALYQAVKIHGEARKFPQELLIGAEGILARVLHEIKSETYTAIGLHEIVQSRYFNAAGEPNPLSSASKAKLTVTVLTINEEHQLEAEPEVPWHPKSVLAFLDCLESIKFAWILVEMASERAVVAYCDWFARQVRSRPAKIDQLRVYWESASWRLAFELRAKNSFQRITEEIMGDTQALQDALNREVQPERPASARTRPTMVSTTRSRASRGRAQASAVPLARAARITVNGRMTAAEIAAIGSLGARGGNRISITVSLSGAMTTASSISISSSSVSSGTGVMAPRNRDSAGRPQSCTKRADPAAFA